MDGSGWNFDGSSKDFAREEGEVMPVGYINHTG